MIPICDYHMHTPLCGHATGQPNEYARQALKIGLQEIGFSDHAPLVTGKAPGITMNIDQLPQYYKMIEDVQEEYKNELAVKVGIEADFIAGYEEQTRNLLKDYPYDYVIGSVHFIKAWGFDNPQEQAQWDSSDINQVYQKYYELLRRSARTQLFNIIGHCDLVKKFGHRASSDMSEEIRKTAQVFKEAGVAVEINTAGLRKPVKEMYPALDALKIYYQAGVLLTFGSDAHQPQDVGKDFNIALQLAQAAGYSEYVTFKKRSIENTHHFK